MVFKRWTSHNIDHLEHTVITFKELPSEVQHYLKNPTDAKLAINSMILEIPISNKPHYKLETVNTWTGPWVDHSKIIEIKTNQYFEIDQGVPSPYIIFNNKLYIPNRFNIFTTKGDISKVKFTKYNLND